MGYASRRKAIIVSKSLYQPSPSCKYRTNGRPDDLTSTLEKMTLGRAAVESKPIVEVDVARHGGEDAPAEPPQNPHLEGLMSWTRLSLMVSYP
jgi:hypothetical protein